MDMNANRIGTPHHRIHSVHCCLVDKAHNIQKAYQMNSMPEIPISIVPANYSRDESEIKSQLLINKK